MKYVALVPIRSGSKSIKDKNINPIAGKPLFWWSLKAAVDSKIFSDIYVSSDSDEYLELVKHNFSSIKVDKRPAELATDTASTESVAIEFAKRNEFDVLSIIQVTTPTMTAKDFVAAKKIFESKKADSLLTAVRTKNFFWSDECEPLNYDFLARPRRQDHKGWLQENGAFYFTRKKTLLETGSRLSGTIAIHEMSEDQSLEIDEAWDWAAIEGRLVENKILPSLKNIKFVFVDVDGTLTDGGMYYSEEGEKLKKFNTSDAQGISMLIQKGFSVGILTGEDSPYVRARMEKLKFKNYYPGIKDKLSFAKKFCTENGLELNQIAMIGDDDNDLELMQNVGFCASPANANERVKKHVDFVASQSGGAGAVREICELILKSCD